MLNINNNLVKLIRSSYAQLLGHFLLNGCDYECALY